MSFTSITPEQKDIFLRNAQADGYTVNRKPGHAKVSNKEDGLCYELDWDEDTDVIVTVFS